MGLSQALWIPVFGLLAARIFSMPLQAGEWEPGPGYRSLALYPRLSGKPGFTLLPPGATGIWFSNSLPESVHLANQILLDGSGVAAGDVDAYRQTCAAMLGRFEKTEDRVTAAHVLEVCVLRDDALADIASIGEGYDVGALPEAVSVGVRSSP